MSLKRKINLIQSYYELHVYRMKSTKRIPKSHETCRNMCAPLQKTTYLHKTIPLRFWYSDYYTVYTVEKANILRGFTGIKKFRDPVFSTYSSRGGSSWSRWRSQVGLVGRRGRWARYRAGQLLARTPRYSASRFHRDSSAHTQKNTSEKMLKLTYCIKI
jgi:hypothetical protein